MRTVATDTKVALRVLGTHWSTPNARDAGWAEEAFDLNPAETGFVALHLWNVGDANGPAIPDDYFVDMGIAEGQMESVRICDTYIRPAIAAARAAGLQIFHVEPGNIAMKYDSVHHMLEEEDTNHAARSRNARRKPTRAGIWSARSAPTAPATAIGKVGSRCALWSPATPSPATR